MHDETGIVSEDVAEALNEVKARGGKIVAVGTTSLRLLESAADAHGRLAPFFDATNLFITPGYRFRFVDRLVTNFHLPRSTLFMLVAAFSGLDTDEARLCPCRRRALSLLFLRRCLSIEPRCNVTCDRVLPSP